MQNILTSFVIPFRVLGFISSKPRVIFLIVIPQILNLIISILSFLFIFNWIEGIISSLDVWEYLRIFLNIFGGIISFLLSGLIILAIGSVVSAPFNSLIVEIIFDQHKILKKRDYSGVGLILYEIFRSIKFEVQKIFVQIIFFVFTMILHLIPVLGSLFFGILNFVFGMYINGLDLNDISNEILRKSFRQKSKIILKNLDLFGPFLAYSTMFLSIPFINILYLPFGVIGSTLLYVEKYEQNKGEIG